jgi:hypothetical protein
LRANKLSFNYKKALKLSLTWGLFFIWASRFTKKTALLKKSAVFFCSRRAIRGSLSLIPHALARISVRAFGAPLLSLSRKK